MFKPFSTTMIHRGFVAHVTAKANRIEWKTEDVATLKKYGDTLTIVDSLADNPEAMFKAGQLIMDQFQRTVDEVLAS